jgi:hypothetical protein
VLLPALLPTLLPAFSTARLFLLKQLFTLALALALL